MLHLRRKIAADPVIVYLSRKATPSQQSQLKWGNLRFGIEESQHLKPDSELLVGLDADMIPEPDWLRRMVPHLLLQDEVAIACCSQVRFHRSRSPALFRTIQVLAMILNFLTRDNWGIALLQCRCLQFHRDQTRGIPFLGSETLPDCPPGAHFPWILYVQARWSFSHGKYLQPGIVVSIR